MTPPDQSTAPGPVDRSPSPPLATGPNHPPPLPTHTGMVLVDVAADMTVSTVRATATLSTALDQLAAGSSLSDLNLAFRPNGALVGLARAGFAGHRQGQIDLRDAKGRRLLAQLLPEAKAGQTPRQVTIVFYAPTAVSAPLSQKMETLGYLSGSIAHEFNNLLSTIIGFSEITLANLPPDSPHHKRLRSIHASGRKSADIIRRMLAASHEYRASPEVFELDTCLRDRMNDLTGSVTEGVSIFPLLNAGGLKLNLPREPVFNLVRWLVATAASLVRLDNRRISLSTRPGEKPAVDSIACGCFEGDAALLEISVSFAPDPAGKDETLRLIQLLGERGPLTVDWQVSLVRDVLNRTGGAMTVTQDEQQSSLTIWLPANSPAPEAPVSRPETRMPRMAVVNDHPDATPLVAETLQHFGYNPTCFQKAGDCLQVFSLAPQSFDVIIIGCHDTENHEFLVSLRKTGASVPVLCLDAAPDDLDCTGLAPLSHLGKPFQITSLLKQLRALSLQPRS